MINETILDFDETKKIENDNFVYLGKVVPESDENDTRLDACGGLVNKEFRLTYSDFTDNRYLVDLSSVEYNRNFLSFVVFNNESAEEAIISFTNCGSFVGRKITISNSNASTGVVKADARWDDEDPWTVLATISKDVGSVEITWNTEGTTALVDKVIVNYNVDNTSVKDLTINGKIKDGDDNPFVPLDSPLLTTTDSTVTKYDQTTKKLVAYDGSVDNIRQEIFLASMTQTVALDASSDFGITFNYDGTFFMHGSLYTTAVDLSGIQELLTFSYDFTFLPFGVSKVLYATGFDVDFDCLFKLTFDSNSVRVNIITSKHDDTSYRTILHGTRIVPCNQVMQMYWASWENM